jgi:hypothetical protein
MHGNRIYDKGIRAKYFRKLHKKESMLMQTPASKHRAIVLTVVLVAIVIAGGIAYIIVSHQQPVSSSSTSSTITCGTVSSNGTEVSSTNCQLGLTFTLSIKSAAIAEGENETLTFSIRNDQTSVRTVNFTSPPNMPGGLNPSSPESSVYLLPTPTCVANVPGYFATYNSSVIAQELNNTPPSETCGISGPGASQYHFTSLQRITQTITLGGVFRVSDPSQPWINATLVPLAPGQYSVVAIDPWSQSLTLDFIVTASSDSSS